MAVVLINKVVPAGSVKPTNAASVPDILPAVMDAITDSTGKYKQYQSLAVCAAVVKTTFKPPCIYHPHCFN